jgi:hypothetical protein
MQEVKNTLSLLASMAAAGTTAPHQDAASMVRDRNAGMVAPSICGTHEMKILTDDPDWARDVYKARALAMMFLRRYGRAVMGSSCSQATANGFTVTYYPNRPLRLTVDEHGKRVLGLEWKNGDAWRMEIETYHAGRWQSRLKAMAYPRPWLERCRALVTFSGSLPPSRAVSTIRGLTSIAPR